MTAQDRGWGSGWPYCQNSRIVGMSIHGVEFPGGVRDDVKPVLKWVADEFHRRVEFLHRGWCWGFSCRAIGDTRIPSNHSWGLAIDINAPNHPQGVRGTFSKNQEKMCRKIARSAGCRWGGDYSTTVDEMHFEFMGTPSEARDLKNKLHITETTETIGELMLNRHDSGQSVKQWQQALKAWNKNALPKSGADGEYGQETADWTVEFQHAHGLPGGMVTPVEWYVMALVLYTASDVARPDIQGNMMQQLNWIRENTSKLRQDAKSGGFLNLNETEIAEALAPKLKVNKTIVENALREYFRSIFNSGD